MNINDDYLDSDNPNANEVMTQGMGWIWKHFIEPNTDEITEEQAEMLTMIGISFKIIAEQADGYDQTFEESPYFNN
tara:strand:+ start:463 stop:690 length:228 start_codon:yes stop_codon:yes gene_type:complete